MTETQTPGRAPANNLSHVAGDASAPLWDLTIPDLLARTVAAHPGFWQAKLPTNFNDA